MSDDELFEIVNGVRLKLPPDCAYAAHVWSRLSCELGRFAEKDSLGAVVCQALFIFDPVSNLRRRPDVAFVSKERLARVKALDYADDFPFSPDFAVEIFSPGHVFDDLLDRISEYFAYNVRHVWVVMLERQEILVYTSAARSCTLTACDELDGGDVVPGFRMSVAEVLDPYP